MDSLVERCCFDADDIDRMVRHFSLAEIDRKILTCAINLGDKSLSPFARQYQLELHDAFCAARDLAEFCFLNNIPTNETAHTTRERSLVREKRLQGLIEVSSDLQRQVSGLNKALANHMKLKKKGQNYQFNE